VATSGPGNDWQFREHHLGSDRPVRRVLRFGQKLVGADVPTVPARYRGVDGPSGRLTGARLSPRTGEVWLRVRPVDMRHPWSRITRTIPLNPSQSPTPTLDVLELRGGMRVVCHDGYIGRLEGIAIDATAGLTSDLLVHIRGDVLAQVDTPTSPMARLLGVAGQRLLLPPAWAVSVKEDASGLPFGGSGLVLHLDASAEQVEFCQQLRPDSDVAGAIWQLFEANPALAPLTASIRIDVHDGDVTLLGKVPTPRHRASAEQDAWHATGVFSLRNELEIRS
jgi:hypothetical protein